MTNSSNLSQWNDFFYLTKRQMVLINLYLKMLIFTRIHFEKEMIASNSLPFIHDRYVLAAIGSRPDGDYQVQRQRLTICLF